MDRISIALVLIAAPLAACASSGDQAGGGVRRVDPISRPAVLAEGWALDVAHEGDVRINGVACGEFDTELAGDEIVSVDKLGRIRLLGRRDGGFGPLELPWPLPMEGISGSREPGGELVQVAAGDLDPEAPGDEIVAVGVLRGGEDDGEPGLVRVLSRSGPRGAWREQRFVTPGLVHAIAVGDVLPAREGLEVLFAGFFGEALVGYVDRESGALLVDAIGATHTGNAKGACLVDDGFVLACDDGKTFRYRRDASGEWALARTRDFGATLARIASFQGVDYAVCANDGSFTLHQRRGDRSGTTALHRVDNRLRGALFVDIDANAEGVEACTAGYDGEIRVVRLLEQPAAGDAFPRFATSKRSVARDTAKIHHLTSGTFDDIGTALVSCGYSGDILVTYPR